MFSIYSVQSVSLETNNCQLINTKTNTVHSHNNALEVNQNKEVFLVFDLFMRIWDLKQLNENNGIESRCSKPACALYIV